jgi:hypothetical protein
VTDAASIMQGLQQIKAAVGIVQGLRAIEGAYQQADFKLRIAELAELLANAQLSLLDAKQEIIGLREEVARLQAAEDVRDKLVQQGGVYYLQEEDGTKRGPYCVRCYQVDRRLISVHNSPITHAGVFRCPQCKIFIS